MMRQVSKYRAVIGSLCVALLCTGCFAHVQSVPNADRTVPSFPPLAENPSILVGITLSGGGSRAAYFGASGLEALAHLRWRHVGREVLTFRSAVRTLSVADKAAG